MKSSPRTRQAPLIEPSAIAPSSAVRARCLEEKVRAAAHDDFQRGFRLDGRSDCPVVSGLKLMVLLLSEVLACFLFRCKTCRTAVRPPVGAGGRSHVTSRCVTGIELLRGESPLARLLRVERPSTPVPPGAALSASRSL